MGDITLILEPNCSQLNFSDEKLLQFKSDPSEEVTTFTLGRGTTGLQIDDKKCSRQQAKLSLHPQSGKVEVTWIGTNPMLFQSGKTGGPFQFMTKDVAYKLQEGDSFTLLLEQYPLRVAKIIKNADESYFGYDIHLIDFSIMKKRKQEEVEVAIPKKIKLEYSDEEESGFSIKEICGNLFHSKNSLAHCVSEDLQMDKGIAKHFKELFGGEDALRAQKAKTGGCASLNRSETHPRHIYYLVTKAKYWQKPTYESLQESLEKMKELIINHKINAVSMPKIGCGLDKLEWPKVRQILTDVFKDINLKITVYSFDKEPEVKKEVVSEGKQEVKLTTENVFKSIKTQDLVKSCVWKDEGSMLTFTSSQFPGSKKVLGFDMDGTLITTKSNKKFPDSRNDWQWWDPKVPDVLKQKVKEGFKIVIFTNQAGITKGKQKAADIKGKIADLCIAAGVPMQAFVASADDINRKPNTSMWDYFAKYCNSNVTIDLSQSMYIGDAAGRVSGWKHGAAKDFSDSDRAFAFNLEIAFQTPEEFFRGEAKATKFVWSGIDPATYATNDNDEIDASDIISEKQELVVCVGFPGSGKSTYTKHIFEANGYVRVNQDTLKTKEACIRACKKALSEGKSAVIDNTNPAPDTRKLYTSIAKEMGIAARCFWFDTPLNLASHLNFFREKVTKGETHRIPKIAYNMYRSKFKEPTRQEGFYEIKKVQFTPIFKNEAEKKLFLQRTCPSK